LAWMAESASGSSSTPSEPGWQAASVLDATREVVVWATLLPVPVPKLSLKVELGMTSDTAGSAARRFSSAAETLAVTASMMEMRFTSAACSWPSSRRTGAWMLATAAVRAGARVLVSGRALTWLRKTTITELVASRARDLACTPSR
jgi:hypothetical protein